MDQAMERAGGRVGNTGSDAAMSPLETVDVLHRLGKP
jgi:6,7-dimethyl-8-ribityllumazine synthase